MTEEFTPYIFKYPLLNRALHFDFLRLRCGTEAAFHEAVVKMHPDPEGRPRTFVAMSEWDAVVILPAKELYPEVLNNFYDNFEIDSKIAGTSGYFSYLWAHDLNANLDDKLNHFQGTGIGLIVSLRFEDWVRRELGLGAEILFCEYLHARLQEFNRRVNPTPPNDPSLLSAIVAHTLGWNDIVCVLHTGQDEERLLDLQSEIRLLTLEDILPAGTDLTPYQAFLGIPLFAASYTHLIGGYQALIHGKLAMGNLAERVATATLLVRVAPALEQLVRSEIQAISNDTVLAEKMPTEMGHYSFSADITNLVHDGDGGNAAMQLLSKIRTFIGRHSAGAESSDLVTSYAETTTFFRFRDLYQNKKVLKMSPPDEQLRDAIYDVWQLMKNLPEHLRGRRSPITAHRFGIVLTTLLDHLSDPIRSSVVRHIKRFLVDTANVAELDRQDMEDLCQIAEYAMAQATDGLAQFQHDANALGLTGRGGYSRLITAIETYVDDLLLSFGVQQKDVLITFGQRLGHAGSVARFHIDIPFNVLFVPSRWYILVHEVGHIVWMRTFGWTTESLAMFEELEREILHDWKDADGTDTMTDEQRMNTRAEFIRTREIVRELFPNLLVYLITCGGDIEAFDRLSLRHILSHSRPGHGMRELLMAVVLNCILSMAGEARRDGKPWMRAFLANRTDKELHAAVLESVRSVSVALDRPLAETTPNHTMNTLKNKQTLLISQPFSKSACEAVQSVLRALRHLATVFQNEKHLEHALFAEIERNVGVLIQDQEKKKSWLDEGFADWLMKGEVLAVSPGAHEWAKLLHDSRDKIMHTDSPAFMISQMAALLSIWHRAEVTAGDRDTAADDILENRLIKLNLVTRKSFSFERR
jgi:hypothetical protein